MGSFAVSNDQGGGAVIRLDQPNFAIGRERAAFVDAVVMVDQPNFVVLRGCPEARHCFNCLADCGVPFHGSMHSIDHAGRTYLGDRFLVDSVILT